jgi:imidazolonepropionase-like amidohydrolase
MKRLALLFLLCAAVLAAETVAITNAKVLTVTNGRFEGSILVKDGKIAALGENIDIPSDARIVDAGGQYVMPGIIDCHSHIASESVNEYSLSVTSMVDIEDVLNPESVSIQRALAGGVTTIMILHGSANAIGGLNSVVKLRWGKDADGLLFEGAKPSIKMALGENPKRRGATPGGTGRYPATRMGVEDVIRQAFTEAKAYRQQWKDYEAKKARGERAIPPRRDLTLEPLVEVLEGERLVHAHAYRADEILMLLRLAEEQGFQIKTLIHALEAYKVMPEIKAHGAGVSTFSDWWGYKVEAYDAIPYTAAMLERAGILTAIKSDSGELMRHMNQEAAKVIKYGGLTEDEALAMITINPAKQMEVDDRVGSLEVGKDADLVIFDEHPLSNYAKVQKVVIDGAVYFDRDLTMSDLEKMKQRKKELLEKQKEKKEDEKAEKPGRSS